MRILITCLFIICSFFSFAQSAVDKKDKYDLIIDSLAGTGHADQLIPFFQSEVKKYPNSEVVNRWLGYLYLDAKNPELGEKYYREALKINPNCAKCYMHIARAYVMKKDSTKGMELLDKANSMDPADADIYSLRSDLKALQGNYVGALLDVNKAIKAEPLFAPYYLQRGLLNLMNGYYDPAIFDYTKAIVLDTNNYNAWLQRGKAYYAKQQYNESINDISKAIEKNSNDATLYSNRGDVYKITGRYKESIADFTKAIEINPDDYYSYYYRADNKLSIEDVEGACDDLNKGYAILENKFPGSSFKQNFEFYLMNRCDTTRPGYYYQKGMGYNMLGEYEKTIDICNRGLEKFPGNGLALFTRGTAYMSTFEFQHAIDDFLAALKSKEELCKETGILNKDKTADQINDICNNFISMTYGGLAQSALSLGKTGEALTYVNKAMEFNPGKQAYGNSLLYMSRGMIYLTSGKYQQAINDLDTCIMYDPKSALAYDQRATASLVMANNIKLVSNPKSILPNGKPSKVDWDFPLDMTINKDAPGTRKALDDCEKALALDPNLESAYFLRGIIHKEIHEGDYCKDLLKAQELQYFVDPKLLKGCK